MEDMPVVMIIMLVVIAVFSVIYMLKKSKDNSEKNKQYLEEVKGLLNSELDFAGAQLFYFGNRRAIAITESGGIALFKKDKQKILSIKDINDYQVNINDREAANLGNAILGGIFFGDAGAIVGSMHKRKKKIEQIELIFNLDDFNEPVFTITAFNHAEFPDFCVSLNEALTMIEKITALLDIVSKRNKKDQ